MNKLPVTKRSAQLLALAIFISLLMLSFSDNPPGLRLLKGATISAFSILLTWFYIRFKSRAWGRLILLLGLIMPLMEAYPSFLDPFADFGGSRIASGDSFATEFVKKNESSSPVPDRLFSMIMIERGDRETAFDLGQANIGAMSGVQNSSGYHPTMLRRYKEIMNVDVHGWPSNLHSFFDVKNRAADLLATKYFSFDTSERYPISAKDGQAVYSFELKGIEFSNYLFINLTQNDRLSLWLPPFKADKLAIVSSIIPLGGQDVEQDEKVARIILKENDGATREFSLRAGVDTAVFNYDSLLSNAVPQMEVLGIPFYGISSWYLKSGESERLKRRPYRVKAIGLLSYLSNADNVETLRDVGKITLISPAGEKVELSLQAGVNTADWAINDSNRKFKHASPEHYRTTEALDSAMNQIEGRDYPAIISLPKPMEVSEIVLENTMGTNSILIIEDLTLVGEGDNEFAPALEVGPPKHKRPPHFADPYNANKTLSEYLTVLDIGPESVFSEIEIKYLLAKGYIAVPRLTLYNSRTNESRPIGEFDRWFGNTEHFKPLFRNDKVAIWENTRSLPRAWLAESALIMPFKDIANTIRLGSLPDGSEFDPLRTVLLESVPDVDKENLYLSVPAPMDRVEFENYSPEKISMNVACSAPRYLVLSEIYFPGWLATVDGKLATIIPADGMLRAILLGTGVHKVKLRFRPPLFNTAVKFSIAGLLVCLIFAGFGTLSAIKRKKR